MKVFLAILSVLTIVAGSVVWSQDKAGHAGDDHVIVRPDAIKWGPAPPALPSGAQVTALVGDPSKTGSYVLRVKLPDGYKIPPHWHPTDENVTVIQGTLLIGKGETFDASKTEALPVGSYMRMPKSMRHFAQAKGETILQVHGTGPFEFNYVNSADDPRKKDEKK